MRVLCGPHRLDEAGPGDDAGMEMKGCGVGPVAMPTTLVSSELAYLGQGDREDPPIDATLARFPFPLRSLSCRQRRQASPRSVPYSMRPGVVAIEERGA